MVKRRGLSDLLRSETQRLEQTDRETESQGIAQDVVGSVPAAEQASTSDPESGSHRLPDSVSTAPIDPVVAESGSHRVTESQSLYAAEPISGVGPKYQQLVRKEARLHGAQYDELTRLARELNRRKTSAGETITANTLLRVAAELLLDRRTELRGDTEEELLASLHQRARSSADL